MFIYFVCKLVHVNEYNDCESETSAMENLLSFHPLVDHYIMAPHCIPQKQYGSLTPNNESQRAELHFVFEHSLGR